MQRVYLLDNNASIYNFMIGQQAVISVTLIEFKPCWLKDQKRDELPCNRPQCLYKIFSYSWTLFQKQ